VGRRAGVTVEQTREDLLDAAARVFARRGYEGATVSEIAAEAGLSSGSIYAHHESKGRLFLAVLEARGRDEMARRLHDARPLDVAGLLMRAGANLDRRPVAERTFLIEAIMAAKHDAEVRSALSGWFADQQERLAGAMAAAQSEGAMDPDFSPVAAARLAAAVSLGTLLLDVLDLPRPGGEDWAGTIERVVRAFQPEPATTPG
jgi:AcrR family transcriptional regulator